MALINKPTITDEYFKESLHKIFLETVRSRIRTAGATINWFTIPTRDPGTINMHAYSDVAGSVTLEEYSDWVEVGQNDSVENKASELGLMCASGFNILLNNAIKTHGKDIYAAELIANNLVFKVTSSPNVADPAGVLLGYMSYRYHFAAGKPLLLTPQEFAKKTLGKPIQEDVFVTFAKAYAEYYHDFKTNGVAS